jgi:beta-glucanase (GH16 family)
MLVASRTSLPRRSDATQERKRVILCPLPTRSTVIYLLLLSLVPFASARDKDPKGWKLVWSDEFKQRNGSAPDPAKWDYALGGNGWGNQELETYTDRRGNSHIEHGKLVITARRENFTGKDGIKREYTSARLLTHGKFAQRYGRFEARIKIPFGQGIWPAFWMLGDRGEWPDRGEIDIMENIGKEPRTVHGTIHGPGYSGEHGIGAPYAIKKGRFADKFHVYAVEWEPNVIRFYVDSHLYKTITPADLPAGTKWVYDEPFYMLLNVAVGGGWPGYPDATSTYPQKMQVDYVRVYQRPEMKKVQE